MKTVFTTVGTALVAPHTPWIPTPRWARRSRDSRGPVEWPEADPMRRAT